MSIFGASWPELTLAQLQSYVDQADDEPLLWEAKGTKLDRGEVRRQVCGFANSHEGGYLILGASETTDDQGDERWVLDGFKFPDEPRLWLANVIADPVRGVRPRPDFDVVAVWDAPNGHVAVVAVEPTPTPPCVANGTVYERLPGQTVPVRDPQRLAALFGRGDAARRAARANADRAAETLMELLDGDAGRFVQPWASPGSEDEGTGRGVRIAVGVAATGNPPDISSRLFRNQFAETVWQELRDRALGLPQGFGTSPDPVAWAQDALTWRHQTIGPVNAITVVRATWDGAVASGVKRRGEDFYPDQLAHGSVGPEWERADDLVRRLRGF